MEGDGLEGLELTHLRYFVALAEELHFGRAAERLHISQPPLTQQIQRLEQRVGHALFARTSRRTSLTEPGRVLYEAALAVLQDARNALDAARRAGRGESGQLTFATPPSLLLHTLPRVIREFRQKFPGVHLQLYETESSRIVEIMSGGGADLALLRGQDIPGAAELVASWKEPLVALLPREHRLARAARVPLKAMAAEPFVFFSRLLGPSFFDELFAYCREAGFAPHVVQEATRWSSVVSLVSAGLGVSIAPACVGKLLSGAVAARPLPRLSTQFHLLRSTVRDSPAASHFVRLLRPAFDKVYA